MQKSIILYKDMEFASHLEYEMACEVLRAAEKSMANHYIEFCIKLNNGNGLWSLCGSSRLLKDAFLREPMEFNITVEL